MKKANAKPSVAVVARLGAAAEKAMTESNAAQQQLAEAKAAFKLARKTFKSAKKVAKRARKAAKAAHKAFECAKPSHVKRNQKSTGKRVKSARRPSARKPAAVKAVTAP